MTHGFLFDLVRKEVLDMVLWTNRTFFSTFGFFLLPHPFPSLFEYQGKKIWKREGRGGMVGNIFLTKLRGPAKDVSKLSTVPNMTLGLSYDFRTPLQMQVLGLLVGHWVVWKFDQSSRQLFLPFADYNIVVVNPPVLFVYKFNNKEWNTRSLRVLGWIVTCKW